MKHLWALFVPLFHAPCSPLSPVLLPVTWKSVSERHLDVSVNAARGRRNEEVNFRHPCCADMDFLFKCCVNCVFVSIHEQLICNGLKM